MVRSSGGGSQRKGGRGTHGSITKAGKVRDSTPKIPPTPRSSKRKHPRCRNRRNYEKRFLKPEPFTLTPKKRSRYKR